jgi:predicted dehydrogenase
LQSFNDIEVQLDQLFPDAHIFLEKPVATGSEAEKSIEEAKKVGEMLKKHKGNVSIGYVPLFVSIYSHKLMIRYVLRYLAAVKMMKKIIEDNNLTV